MKKNVGTADKIIRLLLAFVIVVLLFTGQVSGTIAWVLGIAAVLLVFTSLVSICQLYVPLKVSTRKDTPMEVK